MEPTAIWTLEDVKVLHVVFMTFFQIVLQHSKCWLLVLLQLVDNLSCSVIWDSQRRTRCLEVCVAVDVIFHSFTHSSWRFSTYYAGSASCDLLARWQVLDSLSSSILALYSLWPCSLLRVYKLCDHVTHFYLDSSRHFVSFRHAQLVDDFLLDITKVQQVVIYW